MHEKISALLDDELEQHEYESVLDEVSTDSALAESWQRYHIIRTTMRSEAVHHLPHLVERVRAAIQREPTRDNVAPAPHSASMVKWFSGIRSFVPGVAIAASLAGAVAIGLYTFQSSEPPPATSTATVSDDARFIVDSGTKWETNTQVNLPELQATLNGFLVEHGEFTPASGMNGLMAYAKFVSYDVGD